MVVGGERDVVRLAARRTQGVQRLARHGRGAGGVDQLAAHRDHLAVRVAGPAWAPVRDGARDDGVVRGVGGRRVFLGGGWNPAVQHDRLRRLGQVRLVGRARAEARVEAGEALGEVHRHRPLLVRRVQDGDVEGVQGGARLGGHPRGERGEVDRVVREVQFQEAHVAVAALVAHLVVAEHVQHVVPGVVRADLRGGAVVVAGEHQEDLVVAGDEVLPQVLAVGGALGRDAVVLDVEVLVGGEDHRHRRVLGDDLLGPGEGVGGGPPGQRELQELQTLGLEDVVLGETGVVGAAERGAVGAALVGHEGEVRLGGQVAARVRAGEVGGAVLLVGSGHVVVAGQDRERHVRGVERRQGLTGGDPLLVHSGLVDDVAQVDRHRHGELLAVLPDPARLLGERVGAVPGGELPAGLGGVVAGVELRVRQQRQADARAQLGAARLGGGRGRSGRGGHGGGGAGRRGEGGGGDERQRDGGGERQTPDASRARGPGGHGASRVVGDGPLKVGALGLPRGGRPGTCRCPGRERSASPLVGGTPGHRRVGAAAGAVGSQSTMP